MYSLISPSTTSLSISWSLSQESLSMSALAFLDSDGLSIAICFEFQTPKNFLCCFILSDYRRSDETPSESFRNVEHDNLWGHHVTADPWWLRWPEITTWKYTKVRRSGGFFCTSRVTIPFYFYFSCISRSVCVAVPFFPEQRNEPSEKFFQRSFLKMKLSMHYNVKG